MHNYEETNYEFEYMLAAALPKDQLRMAAEAIQLCSASNTVVSMKLSMGNYNVTYKQDYSANVHTLYKDSAQ